VRPGIVTINTLAAVCTIRDEKDNSEMTAICKRMQRLARGFGGVVVGVRHYGKTVEARPRGASAWRASSEFVIGVTADIDELNGLVSNRQLAAIKTRDGGSGPVGSFTLEPIVVEPDGVKVEAPHLAAALEGGSQFKGPAAQTTPHHDSASRGNPSPSRVLDCLPTQPSRNKPSPYKRVIARA
jgi:hypothetical protein